MPNNFDDLLINVFSAESETVHLDEAIQIPSLIALTAFKKKALDKFKAPAKEKKSKKSSEVKASGEKFKEKTRATAGKTTGEDVYKLTREQKSFLADLYNKYGKKLIKEITDFRREVLAPYNLIKRKMREAQTTTGKEVVGISKKEWERAKESGKNKIEDRKSYGEDLQSELRTVDNLENQLKSLFEIKRMLSSQKELTSDEKAKINKKMDTFVKRYISKAKYPEGVSIEKVREYKNQIDSAFKRTMGDLKSDNTKQAIDSFKGYINKLTGKYDPDEYDASLDNAINTYIFQENIRRKLTQAEGNAFKNMYNQMLNEMIEEKKKGIKKHNNNIDKMKKDIRFTDNESKIWGRAKNAPELSGDMSNYYLRVKEKDFEGKSERRKESEDVKEARRNIEKAIDNFKASLKEKLSSEDYKKLNQYKLLQTLKLSELEDAKNLFKSKEEVQKSFEGEKDEA
jgi:hypothetical protein